MSQRVAVQRLRAGEEDEGLLGVRVQRQASG